MKKTFLLVLLSLCVGAVLGQRKMEKLDRGLVAVKTSNGVYTSWRIPGDEYYDVKYNLYRNGSLIAEGLEVSNYLDASGAVGNTYTVAPVIGGQVGSQSSAASVWANQYLEIPLSKVIDPKTGRDVTSSFSVGDGTVADLDGDGQYELIVKRQNTDFTVTNDSAYTRFEAYEFDGTKLWEINLGPNMRDGNGSENACYAFDFDQDGKAEVIFRGGDGTILPDGVVLGNKNVNYRSTFTGTQAFMTDGDEFIVMLDGATGRTLDYQIFDSNCGTYNTSNDNKNNPAKGVYEPGTSAPGNNLARRSEYFWNAGNTKGDGGHRATKFYFGAPYLDGVHPYVYLGRGAYTNFHAATWKVVNKKLQLHWACAVDDWTSEFYGQGYHNFTICDVDGDGRDEMCQGNMVVDEYGKFHSSTGLGHGDAQHYGDLDPFRDGVEAFRCLEDNPGCVYVDANTNEILFRWKRGSDCGRCMAGNFTDKFPGAQLWTVDNNLWSATTTRDAADRIATSAPGVTMNARIYWDGDILEEAFDYTRVADYQGYDVNIYKYGNSNPIFQTSGCLTINSTKGNPVAQADIFGDWREELILPTANNRAVRIYTTVAETKFRNYTLMHDPQYRQAVYWQSSGYNQPPHVSYFLGNLEGIVLPPPPAVTNGKSELGASLTSATNGQFVIGYASSNTTVNVENGVSPSYLQINSPADYALQGGSLTGKTTLLKQGLGNLTLSGGTYSQTGNTEVWYGSLTVNENYTTSPILLKRFAKLNSNAALGKVNMQYGSVVRPAGNAIGTLQIGTLTMEGGAIIEFDVQNDGSSFDVLTVDSLVLGSANCIGATPTLSICRTSSGKLAAGEYQLIKCQKGIKGDVSAITVDGLKGLKYEVKQSGNAVVLVVEDMRVPTEIVLAQSGTWDLDKTASFLLDGQNVTFVTGDHVTIDASAAAVVVTVSEDVEPASLTIVGNKSVTINGTGRIGGSCKLIKKGDGQLTINNVNNYTGGTWINEGVLNIKSIADAQNDGALGAFSDGVCKIHIGSGAKLNTTVDITNSNPIEVGDSAIICHSKNWVQQGALTGVKLVKQGAGTMSFEVAPTCKKVEIQAGVFATMVTTTNCLGDTCILRGGTLKFDDSSYSYGNQYTPWVVPAGCTASVSLDRRCNYMNKLFGSGTLTLNLPNDTSCPRTTLQGDWSAFEGTINFVTGNTSRYFSLCNTYGLPKAKVNIATAGHTLQIGGDNVSTTGTFRIGTLTGKGTLVSGSSATNTFEVGALNANFTFDGTINASFVKVGTGTLTLTNSQGNGAITIREGSLRAKGGSYTSGTSYTSATGKGPLVMESGTMLEATGCLGNSSVTIKDGALFRPGYVYTGTIALAGIPNIKAGATIEFRLSKDGAVNKFTGYSNFTNAGTVRVVQNTNYVPAAGDRFNLWSTRVYAGTNNPTLELFDLPDSLMWNTDSLNTTEGLLKVVANPDYVNALEQVKSSAREDGVYYNMVGQPAAVLKRGQIYILNGKKIIW